MKDLKPHIGDLVLLRTAHIQGVEPFLRCMLILSKTEHSNIFICVDNFYEFVLVPGKNSHIREISLGDHYNNFTVIRNGEILCEENKANDEEQLHSKTW